MYLSILDDSSGKYDFICSINLILGAIKSYVCAFKLRPAKKISGVPWPPQSTTCNFTLSSVCTKKLVFAGTVSCPKLVKENILMCKSEGKL